MLNDPRSRSTDPASSHEAAVDSYEFSPKHESQIFLILTVTKNPMTAWRISLAAGLDYHAVARRLKEMERKGLIERAGFGDGKDGRKSTLWRASDAQ